MCGLLGGLVSKEEMGSPDRNPPIPNLLETLEKRDQGMLGYYNLNWIYCKNSPPFTIIIISLVMFFKNHPRQSLFTPTEPSNSRPSSFNKENYLTRTNDITPIESRMSLQSSNLKLLNRSDKTPTPDTTSHCPSTTPKLSSFMKKVSNYLAISNVLIQQAESLGNTSGTLLRQIKKLGDRIQSEMEEYKVVKASSDKSEGREWDLVKTQLLKRIQELEGQVQRLRMVAQEHQDQNLKIMIQMNQTESGNISYFKSQLEESFQAYKVLEEKVQTYKLKLKQMQNIKTLVERESEKKSDRIEYLEKQMGRNDRRASLNEDKGIKGLLIDRKLREKEKERERERLRYTSVINSITSSVSNYTSNNHQVTGSNYLKCGDITELEDFISS